MSERPDDLLARRAAERVASVADSMSAYLAVLARTVHAEVAEAIPELRADPVLVDLLGASMESNFETFFHVTRYAIALDEVTAPSAALEYARRLAQRGTSSNALLRAYRLGQQLALAATIDELSRQEQDGRVALASAKVLQESAFAYVDRVSEQVVTEYERERERWLEHRSTVRATTLAALLAGTEGDIAAAEQALGYRLRQQHLGVVAWAGGQELGGQELGGQELGGQELGGQELGRIEGLVAAIASAVGSSGEPLLLPQDRALAWGWIPLARKGAAVDAPMLERVVRDRGEGLYVALGRPAASVQGFRSTHVEALRAREVALTAGARARAVTSYGESGVQVAALLTHDLPSARELVADALGGLAVDEEGAQWLRETLLTFLSQGRSYQATAERLHLHRNTVKYRIDKAVEARGRPLDDERLTLEMALVASQWLGAAVLAAKAGTAYVR